MLPTGFTGEGEGVLTTALANGFTPNIVNIMTMDYGTSGTEMGAAANQALDSAAGQLESIYGISQSAAYAMLGNTPMIGQNDTPGEIFTLADAATVESYAAQQGIGWLSFWAEGRDNGGCPGDTSASSTCSGISQSAAPSPRRSRPSPAAAAVARRNADPDPDPDRPTPTPTPRRLLRGRLGQQHRLHVRQRGLLRRQRLDRQPVELRRGARRRRRRLEQRRTLLTETFSEEGAVLCSPGGCPPVPRGVAPDRSDNSNFSNGP